LPPPEIVEDLLIGIRFLRGFPGFLRYSMDPPRARAILDRRFRDRQADFLRTVREGVYRRQGSPYRRLLEAAGCEYGDLDRLVRRDGVDDALQVLRRQGVYVTLDEFKGRRPVVRGTTSFTVDPAQFRNPLSGAHVAFPSGGSRGKATPILFDFAFIRDLSVNTCVVLADLDGLGWTRACWDVPGSGVMIRVLDLASLGMRLDRWFSYVDPALPGLPRRYRWSFRTVCWGSRMAGRPIPHPVHVAPDDPLPIVRWMTSVLRAGGTPHLLTYATSAVRLAQAALDAGLDLRGARIWVGGEPLTPARAASIRRSGAEPWTRYATMESGAIAAGCLAPEASDDVHVYEDLHAVIQPDPVEPDGPFPPGALLVSAIRPTAPLVLINASTGDRAVRTKRQCGCPLERRGWTTHLRTVRSFEKLTAGGMTFLDAHVVQVLEETLPARFGGGPTDYQLLEEETTEGYPRLRLLVHPRLPGIDPEGVARVFLETLGADSAPEGMMERIWQESAFVTVERSIPRVTVAGKIQHVHVERGRVTHRAGRT
jgi:hypothetical protein